MTTNHRLLDDELLDHIAGLDIREQENWLFLSPHPDYAGRWYVDSLHSGFLFDFEDLVGKYRVVSPASLSEFLEHAKELQYEIAFIEDPVDILSAWEHLNDPPVFKLDSDMAPSLIEKGEHYAASIVEQTGMLPFQVQGFNYLRREDIKGGHALWSTGTGKTALEAALIKQHMEVDKDYDLALCVVTANNKADTQIKLRQLGGIESFIIEGTKEKRQKLYDLFYEILELGQPLVGITNYEKFREEEEEFTDLIEGRRVLVFFDEMPTKLRNRQTQLYQSVRRVLYASEAGRVAWDEIRPKALRIYELSATPIEKDPLDQVNCIRLIDPDVFPSVGGWEREHVALRDFISKEPKTFKNLDKMGLDLSFMTHQVDKEDPDIARLFPEIQDIPIYIDWHPSDRATYEKLQEISKELLKKAKEDDEIKTFNALQLISVLQMICDAPSMVAKSASNREEFEALLEELSEEEGEKLTPYGSEAALTLVRSIKKKLDDKNCTKLKELRDIITRKHPDQKIVVFSRLASYIQPVLENAFKEWGVAYVVFRGTQKQRQKAKDQFRTDPDIQVFLSSDAGSNSTDLPEASVAIDYDLPLKYSTKVQRRNRIHRVNSQHKFVTFYSLMMADSVEQRIEEIIERKRGYFQAIYRGEMSEEALSARMTADDLYYALTGEYPDELT